MIKTKDGHYQYSIEEIEALGYSDLTMKLLFGNTIKEMKAFRKRH